MSVAVATGVAARSKGERYAAEVLPELYSTIYQSSSISPLTCKIWKEKQTLWSSKSKALTLRVFNSTNLRPGKGLSGHFIGNGKRD